MFTRCDTHRPSAVRTILNWLAIVPDEPSRAKGYSSWTPPRPDTLLFRASLPPSSSSATLEASSAPRRPPTPASYLSLRLRRLLQCSDTSLLPTEFFGTTDFLKTTTNRPISPSKLSLPPQIFSHFL